MAEWPKSSTEQEQKEQHLVLCLLALATMKEAV